ncbi:MAG: DUF4366 domain-containing protein [Ruminococcus sp.]|uniref:CD1107 family mobile element protein n=1 Tax=Ruminococcus sp. TaxID=41978 RepID=UPI0025D50E38|nr:DUF4366 domain-containing protein [Ruminococcus sp.]MBR0529018.1 DUF4366 domain-containing protein [Ruminococcus sp.]
MKRGFFSAVLAAAVLAAASATITASAAAATEGTTEEVTSAVEETVESSADTHSTESTAETESISETAAVTETTTSSAENTDSSISDEDMEKFRRIMNELAEAGTTEVEPDYYGDPYYDTDGNATLIKSESIIYNTEEMQFIAVTTKDGHVFYVLINYSAESGQDNVYFLNRVDDYDLYALLYAGEEDEDGNAKFTPEEALQAAEEANGRVKHGDDAAVSEETTEASSEDESGDETPAGKTSANMGSVYLLVGAVALIGVGAGGFFLFKKKNGGSSSKDEVSEYEDEDDDFEFSDDTDTDE